MAARDPSEPLFDLDAFSVVRLDAGRTGQLQAFYEEAHDYFELATGAPPAPGEARLLLEALPRGKTHADKYVVGLLDAPGRLAGVLDIIRDYPAGGDWYLGLLLIGPAWRGRGLGERVYRRLEEWVRAGGGRKVHLIVQEQNPGAIRFWRRMGFEVQGLGRQLRAGGGVSVFLRMAKPL